MLVNPDCVGRQLLRRGSVNSVSNIGCRQPSGLCTSGREATMDMRKCGAEVIGTAWLTFAGCGSAVIAAGFPQVGIGLLGVSLAFGLTVLTMAYAIGHISG